MTPEIITTFVIVAFLVILLAGFLFGLARGFNKSLVRILLIVAMLVITFFVVPSITKAIMTLDISNWGVSIGGETATSVGDIIVSILNQIPQVADIAGTDAYATIINVVPQMLLNVVLFVVVFILLRLVSMIIYWIIWGICFNKKKTEGKNKHRLLGSLVGVIQNFLIFLVILVPVIGTVNILGDIETITNTPAAQTVSTTGVSDPATPTDDNADNNQISPYQTVTDVIYAYNDSWVAKFLHAVKLDNVCMYVFDELSTVTEDNQEYNLKTEAINVTHIVLDVQNLMSLGEFDLSNTETIAAINKVIDSCYQSNLTANLIDEVVPLATSKWINGETFCGISKPTIEGYDGVINDLLLQLGSAKDVHSSLISTTNLLSSVFNTAKNLVSENGVDVTKIGTLLNDLNQDQNTLDLAKNLLTEENITTIVDSVMPGEDTENFKGIITETITSVLNADYTQEGADISNEINVITQTLNATEKLINPDAENPFEQADANAVIESLSESTVILNTLSASDSEIRTKLNSELAENTDAQDMIKAAIDNLPESNANKATLLEIFGFAAE